MVYVFAVIGFIIGFVIGQIILLRLLKDRTNEEILNNRSLKWTYGLLNWVTAAIGAYIFTFLYNYF